MKSPLLWLAGAAWLLGAAPAAAQQASPHSFPTPPSAEAAAGIPDVPAGPATLRVTVVHERDRERSADVPLVLYALSPSGVPGLRGATSGPDGSYEFAGIANDPEIVYLVGARYAGVPFGLRLSFEAGQTERSVELPVSEPTSSRESARIDEAIVRFDASCSGVSVVESYVVRNDGDAVIFIPEEERRAAEPILQVPLPRSVADVESAAGDDLIWNGDSVKFWGPLRPGQRELQFAYGMTATDGALEVERRFPSGAGRLRLLSHAAGPQLEATDAGGAPLAAAEPVELEGKSYDSVATTGLAAGATLEIGVRVPPRPTTAEALTAEEARIWLELDGAALTVDEQYQLRVAGDAPLRSESGAPVLCLDLPGAAENLRFSQQALDLGLDRDPSGALAIRGPIPAGPSELSLRYRLPVDRDAPRIERIPPLDLPLLSVFIADTGLIVENDRLHRRRPMRTQDRTYLRLEGFQLPAGEPIDIRLRPREARASLSGVAALGLAAAFAAFSLGFLVGPFRRDSEEGGWSDIRTTHLSDERESVLSAIRSLDEDHEVGKLTDDDHRELREQLRAEAVELLRRERETRSATSTAARPAPTCESCGAALTADARFCSQCGSPVAVEPGSAGGGVG